MDSFVLCTFIYVNPLKQWTISKESLNEDTQSIWMSNVALKSHEFVYAAYEREVIWIWNGNYYIIWLILGKALCSRLYKNKDLHKAELSTDPIHFYPKPVFKL